MVKRVSLEIKNRKKFKYGIEHKTMPSKAIGMGVCPRCGKPGTVVIKAGNYVYIKHGNTWHYIGTIDKVNLNKILIKNPELLALNYVNNKKNINIIKKKNIALIILLVFAMLFAVIFYIVHTNNISKMGYNSTNYKIISCLHIVFANDNNSNYIMTCNNASLQMLNNFTVVNYNYYNGTFNIK
ncbi:MAG: hypothetical protein RXO23_06125 [Vulcanisaeta sp.]